LGNDRKLSPVLKHLSASDNFFAKHKSMTTWHKSLMRQPAQLPAVLHENCSFAEMAPLPWEAARLKLVHIQQSAPDHYIRNRVFTIRCLLNRKPVSGYRSVIFNIWKSASR
jgi:hypothetical protein